MAKLIYKYSTMKAGKSLELLKVQDSYTSQGKKVFVATSAIDNRSGVGKVVSRVGLEQEAYPIINTLEGAVTLYNKVSEQENLSCVLVDEAQFLSKEVIVMLTNIVDELGIPVVAYGLKNDFRNRLFEGTEYLLIYADKIEEIKSICPYCERKATMNARVNSDGVMSTLGDTVKVGGDDEYVAVCRQHYKEMQNKANKGEG